MTAARSLALVTGATGGIGRACARRLGSSFDLVLSDIDAGRLDALAGDLRRDGATVLHTVAADLGEDGRAAALVQSARARGPLSAVLHAAGVSPALAGADAILHTNLIATEHLLRAIEDDLQPDFVAVLIASVAGHTPLPATIVERLASDPAEAGFAARLANAFGAPIPPPLAYCISKRWVVRAAEQRAAAWGRQGARILSISPGLIDTAMGRAEIAATPGTQATLDRTPLGWGRPDDIAAAAAFLCSPDARFITGCDLLVDGGAMPAMRAAMA